jgi:Phosphoesterase family
MKQERSRPHFAKQMFALVVLPVAGIVLCASPTSSQQGSAGDAISPGFFSPPSDIQAVNAAQIRPLRNAAPSYAWRVHGGKRDLIAFSTPIQHVVLIYLENRTPEDLFGAFFNSPDNTGRRWGDVLDLVDPVSIHLTPEPLEHQSNPGHEHQPSFVQDALGNWTKGFWYVPTPAPPATPEVANYITLIGNFGYANHVLQSNEGPSFEAHQYSISGQTGGLGNSNITPRGMVNNPGSIYSGQPDVDEPGGVDVGKGTCFTTGNNNNVQTTNMGVAYPGNQETSPTASPCNEYPTILDAMAAAAPGVPPYLQWQYIASKQDSIWAAPMAIRHHYNTYVAASTKVTQPFAVDPDAENWVLNVTNSVNPPPNPVRPFAELTYLTPCLRESDHPNDDGVDRGPAWLGYIVNAVESSSYWPNTAIIVTWDDWGGFYDNYLSGSLPLHPNPNVYQNAQDPNEWGFRVPVIVISPWVRSKEYVSTVQQSQGAILNFVETIFNLGPNALGGDDANNTTNDLTNIFDFSMTRPTLPPVTLQPSFTPQNQSTCPPA